MINQTHNLSPVAPPPGFDDVQAQSQAAFRALLSAMSRPGTVLAVEGPASPPAGLNQAACAACLTLVDLDTPLWLQDDLHTAEVETFLRFHCGCPLVEDTRQARFGLLNAGPAMTLPHEFHPGDPAYPDRSATLIIQVVALTEGKGRTLEGPGIDGSIKLHAEGLDGRFWESFRANREFFPQGVDVILAAPREVAGLPRSVRVVE